MQKSCGTQLPNGKQLGLLCCVAEHFLEEVNTLEIRVCVLSYWEKWSSLTHFDWLEKFYCRLQESSMFFSTSLLLVHCFIENLSSIIVFGIFFQKKPSCWRQVARVESQLSLCKIGMCQSLVFQEKTQLKCDLINLFKTRPSKVTVKETKLCSYLVISLKVSFMI